LSLYKTTLLRLKGPHGKILFSIPNKNHENIIVTDSLSMANEFKKFFCSVGQKISNSVNATKSKPEDYNTDPDPNVTQMEFGTFTQAEFINIISKMESKASQDIDGLSNKMIKFVKYQIATPLEHLFNLNFQSGKFPSKLKISIEQYQFINPGTQPNVIIIVLSRSYRPSLKF
jgi:hypothetical protein